ncbi:OmpL47-type beta-barrel domain-containing protein [Sediminispirochaeta bajacaliforniensis]|uniref:OmpL47-type beta-barrel domain-containing protein n=1 Tax=Sediminispirochaeta bajacaliforniensis TaxID=148 RepID=UPI0003A267B9|nr:putative Ig domain-containing protein [Sediminispirochaeta bajacaliforniensis]
MPLSNLSPNLINDVPLLIQIEIQDLKKGNKWHRLTINTTHIYRDTIPPEFAPLDVSHLPQESGGELNPADWYTDEHGREWNRIGVSVSAGASDDGAGIDEDSYQYKIDEGAWLACSENQEIEIRESGIHTVTFKVSDQVGNVGTTSTVVYIDKDAPNLSVANPSSGWSKDAVLLVPHVDDEHSGVDEDTLQYRMRYGDPDEIVGPWSDCENGKDLTIERDGLITVDFQVRDHVTNQSTASTTVKVDKQAPSFHVESYQKSDSDGSLSAFDTDLWSNQTVVLRAAAEDQAGLSGLAEGSLQYSLGGTSGPWNNYTAGDDVEIAGSGITNIAFRAFDVAGNSTVKVVPVKIDRAAPGLTVQNMGKAFIQDGTGPAARSWTNTDVALYVGAVSPSADNETPLLQVLVDNGEGSVAPLAGNARYRINGGTWNDFTGKVTVSGQGRQKIDFSASDEAGNETNTSTLFYIDKLSPVVDISSSGVEAGQTSTWQKKLVYEVAALDESEDASYDPDRCSPIDEASYRWSVKKWDGNAYQAWRSGNGRAAEVEKNNTAVDGRYSVTYTVSDIVGNRGSGTGFVKIDRNGPDALAYTGNGWVNTISAQDFSASDAPGGSGVDPESWRWKEGDEWKELSLLSQSLEEGINVVLVKVADKAGNEGEEAEVAIQFDSIPPEIFPVRMDGDERKTLEVKPTTGYYNDSPFLFTAEVSDPIPASGKHSGVAALSYRQNGTLQDWDGSLLEIDAEGSYDVVFYAEDGAGNTSSAEVLCVIDRSDPVLSYSGLPGGISEISGWTDAASVVVSAVCNDGSLLQEESYAYSLDGGLNWTAYTPSGGVEVVDEGITSIWFSVSDLAGNTGNLKAEVKIDRSGPRVTAGKVSRFLNGDGNLIVEGLAADDGVGVGLASSISYEYSIDGSSYIPLAEDGRIALDKDELSEGLHTILISGQDLLGNKSRDNASAATDLWTGSFAVDKSAPTLTGIKVSEDIGGGEKRYLEAYEYALSDYVDIEITGEDYYLHSGGKKAEGELVGFDYYLSNEPVDPDNGDFHEEQKGLSLEDLKVDTGPNYLYLRLIDAGGNRSLPAERIIRHDNGLPATPKIEGLTHPEAKLVTDAAPFDHATFRIIAPEESVSGLSGFAYTLSVGAGTDWRLLRGGEIDASGENIECTELEDNEVGEFYLLTVRSVGGNGRESGAAEYQFRVDTSPPEHLRVYAQPQSNPVQWYNQQRSTIGWDTPVDMTGVRRIYYRIATTEIVLPEDDETLEAMDLSSWNTTTDDTILLSLGDLSEEPSGACYIALVAEDYAGNRDGSATSFFYDLGLPTFGDSGEDAEVQLIDSDAQLRKATIAWSAGIDDGDIVREHVKLAALHAESGTLTTLSQWTLCNEPKYTFYGLSDTVTYIASVRLSDRAGNSVQKSCVFTLDGEMTELDIPIPFRHNYDGFVVEGTQMSHSGGVDAHLLLPENIILCSSATGERFSEVTLTDADLENGLYASDPSTLFSFIANGFVFQVNGLHFSEEEGLSFDTAEYRREELIDGEQQEVSYDYGPIVVSFPPLTSILSSGTYAHGQAGYHFENESWSFDDIHTTRMGGGYRWLDSGTLSTLFLEHRGVMLFEETSDGLPVYALPVKAAAVDSSDTVQAGTIDHAFFLQPIGGDGVKLRVESAKIKEDRIIILKSFLLLPAGYEPREVVVENYAVTSEGKIDADSYPDFRSGGFQFESNEQSATYRFGENSLRFIDGVLYAQNGHVDIARGDGTTLSYEISRLAMGNDGADWRFDAPVSGGVSFTIHDYLIESEHAVLTETGMLLKQADIVNIPPAFGGGSWRIENLGIRLTDESIYRAGVSEEEIGFLSPEGGYQGEVYLQGLSLTDEGLFAPAIDLVSPDGIGPKRIRFEKIALVLSGDSAGGGYMGTGTLAPGLERLVVGNYSCEVSDVGFTGTAVTVGSLSVPLPEEVEQVETKLSNLIYGGEGIRRAATGNEVLNFSSSGWNFFLTQLELNEEGLGGDAALVLPEGLGGEPGFYPDFRLFPSGAYESGEPLTPLALLLNDVPVTLTDSTIEGDELIAETAVATIGVLGEELKIEIPGLRVNSSGDLIESGSYSGHRSFISSNNFPGEIESCAFAASKELHCRGRVSFTDGMGEGASAEYSGDSYFTIDGYGNILAGEGNNAVDYRYNGWRITGSDYAFDYNGLRIGRNLITIPNTGKKAEIGELTYYSDGTLGCRGYGLSPVDLPFFGGEFSGQDFEFSDEGLSASVFIQLAPALGGERINFQSVTFYPDGSFSSDTVVRSVKFELGGCTLLFENLFLTKNGLQIGDVSFTLPQALEADPLRIHGVRIDNNGNWQIGSIDPIDIWGMTFTLDGLAFEEGIIDFSGSVLLPKNLPEGLGGKRLAIKSFRISTGGELLDLDVSLQSTFTFYLTDSWKLEVGTLSLEKREDGDIWLLIKTGRLYFPPGFITKSGRVSNLGINIRTGAFDVEGIALEALDFKYAGLTFRFNEIGLNQDEYGFGLSFKGSVALPNSDALPSPIRGKVLTVDAFEMNGKGEVVNIAASASGVNGTFFDALTLQNGTLGFGRVDGDFIIRIGGDILLGDIFPSGIAGLRMNDAEIGFTINTWELLSINAVSTPKDISLFGVTTIADAQLAIHKGEGANSFSLGLLSGHLKLPDGLPDYLAGEEIDISSFIINSEGKLESFASSFSVPERKTLFGGVKAEGTNLSAVYDKVNDRIVFDLGGTLILDSSFPVGIAGTSCAIKTLRFDSDGNIETIDVRADIVDQKLFGTMPIADGAVALKKDADSNSLVTSVSGTLSLPVSFPGGLSGLPVAIRQFSIDSNGIITALDIRVDDLDTELFGGASLSACSLRARNGSDNEILFDISGKILLPSALTSVLGGLGSVDIETLTLSSRKGITDFKAGIGNKIEFDLFAGITASSDALYFNENGVSLAGTLRFPDNFYEGLAGVTIELKSLDLDWDGSISNIEAGLRKVNIELLGMPLEMRDIVFDDDGIGIDSAVITLPAILGYKDFGLRNVRIDRNGQFHGDFIVPDMEFDVAGFTLLLIDPYLDFEHKAICFSKTRLITPAIVGGSTLDINDVSIGSEGFRFSGIGFGLPEFTIAGGLSFSLSADFAINDGEYYIAAEGLARIPGLGALDAIASFTNVSHTYPWGLKRAYFSFESDALGIPLGPTGLFMNGIGGGLAFGPPDELPPDIRPYFDEGTRIQIHVSMIDGSGGNILRGSTDVWLDISNWEIALEGNAHVLHGMIHSELLAAITNDVLYGSIEVELKFVDGRVELWIYKDGKKTKIAGQGEVKFGLRKGCIHDGWFVDIPWKSFWIKTGAMFGEFTNGKSGICGYVHVPLFGNIGAFVSHSGKLHLGSVSSYDLDVPRARMDARLLDVNGLNVGGQFENSLLQSGASKRRDDSVYYYDRSRWSGASPVYSFSVPGKAAVGPLTRSLSTSSQTVTVEKVAKIIFAVGYKEGNPSIRAISPSGRSFMEGSEGVEAMHVDNGYLMAISDPEAGRWSIEIEGLAESAPYTVDVLGTTAAPEIEVVNPERRGVRVDSEIIIEGSAYGYAGKVPTVQIFFGNEENGSKRAVTEAVASPNGSFRISVDTSTLPEGEYTVSAQVNDGSDIPVSANAEGTIVVDHPDARPERVTDLIVAYKDETSAELAFSDPAEGLSQGYIVYLTASDGTSRSYNIGALNSWTLARMQMGESYEVAVAAYNGDGEEGPVREVSYRHRAGNDPYNRPEIAKETSSLRLVRGEPAELSVAYEVVQKKITGSAQDYMDVKVTDAPDWFFLAKGQDSCNLSDGDGSISFNVATLPVTKEDGSVVEYPAPGHYEATLRFANMGNRELFDEIGLGIDVVYPQPEIIDVEPASFHTQDGALLAVSGRNFLEGSRIFLNDDEIIPASLTEHQCKIAIAPGMEPGEYNLSIEGPGGDRVSQSLTIVGPSYRVKVYKSISEVNAGEKDRYFLELVGEDRFDGLAYFSVKEASEGLSVHLLSPSVAAGEICVVEVDAAAGLAALRGSFVLESDQGDLISFDENVTEGEIDPLLSCIAPGALLAGESFSIYGNGFGSERGSVTLNGEALNIEQWSDDRIVVTTGASAVSGTVVVDLAGKELDAGTLQIKDTGFSLYPEMAQLRLQPGDSASFIWAVQGVAIPVELEPFSAEAKLSVTLDKSSVTPNGAVNMTITAEPGIKNGRYQVELSGNSRLTESSKSVEVIIGDGFEIETTSLPDGLIDGEYSAQLSHKNNDGEVSYSCSDGRLPYGLMLKRDGRIVGVPSERGSESFTVTAEDAGGHSDSREYSITITENVWGRAEKDSGRRRYIPIEGPAEAVVKWKSQAGKGADAMIAGSDRLFVREEGRLRGVEIDNGRTIFTRNESLIKMVYQSGMLYILSDEGLFSAVESSYGNTVWQREEIENFTLSGTKLVLWSGDKRLEIQIGDDAETIGGTVSAIEEETDQAAAKGVLFWKDEQLCRLNGREIMKATEDGWESIYTHDTDIFDVAVSPADGSDGSGLVLIADTGGKLTATDGSFQRLWSTYTGMNEGSLILGQNRAGIYASDKVVLYDVKTGSEVVRRFLNVRDAALCREKLYIATDNDVRCLNLYSGNEIFTLDKQAGDIIVSNNSLFFLGQDGELMRYQGRTNVYPPETTIMLSPASPDGTNGWYKGPVDLAIRCEDAETYPADISYTFDGREWNSYTAPFRLPQGVFGIRAYGTDSYGYQGAEDVVNLRIDSEPPTTVHAFEGKQNSSGWFTGAVKVSLEASDGLSGIQRTEYRLNGGEWMSYAGPFTLGTENDYLLEYRSVDRAGGLETTTSIECPVDLYEPETNIRFTTEPGLGLVYLSATDSQSGVDRVEYRIDGGESRIYASPLVIEASGSYEISYRSIDKAGREEAWKSEELVVPAYGAENLILNLHFAYYSPGREVVENIQEGQAIYSPSYMPFNRFSFLPDYLKGSLMIRTNLTDRFSGTYLGEFTAGSDMDLFILRDARSHRSLPNMELVEEAVTIGNRFYFPRGADIYRHHYRKGERVVLPGTGDRRADGLLYFVRPGRDKTVRILSPMAEALLYPLERIDYHCHYFGDDARGYRWFVRIDDGSWQQLRTDSDGSYTIDYTEKQAVLGLRVEALDAAGKVLASSEEYYVIENLGGCQILSPGPGMEVEAGSRLELDYRIRNIAGDEADLEQQWFASRDGTDWQSLSLDHENGFRVPEKQGPLYLRSRTLLAEGHWKECQIRIEVVQEIGAITIGFGDRMYPGAKSLGEPFGPRVGGLEYGFSCDHSERMGSYRVLDSSRPWDHGGGWQHNWGLPKIQRHGFIRLKGGERFLWQLSAKRRYLVRIKTGPIGRRDRAGISIGGVNFDLERRWNSGELYLLECEVETSDGILEIRATDGFPIESVEIQALREGDPPVSQTIDRREEVVIGGAPWLSW